MEKKKQNKTKEGKRKEKKKWECRKRRKGEWRRGGGRRGEERERLSLRPTTTGHNMEMHSDWSAVYLGMRYSSVCVR